MTGTVVNAIAIVSGATLGVVLKRGIPERYNNTIIQGLSLAVMVIGLQMAITTKNPLVVVLSLVVGGFIGELLKIEPRLEALGGWFERKVGKGKDDFAKGFVTASLVYCIGAMAIMGAIQDGIKGDPSTLYVKSLLDGVSGVFFASTMGIGVAFSAVPVFLYQGAITVLSQYVQGFLTPSVITEMTATGGVLILGIGIKILGIKDVKVGNLLPSVIFSVFFALVFAKFGF